jgi:hypothetical protein
MPHKYAAEVRLQAIELARSGTKDAQSRVPLSAANQAGGGTPPAYAGGVPGG